MKKTKRFLAILAVTLLLGLYLATLIFALIPGHQELFRGCIAATILLPVLLYAFALTYRRKKDSSDAKEENEN